MSLVESEKNNVEDNNSTTVQVGDESINSSSSCTNEQNKDELDANVDADNSERLNPQEYFHAMRISRHWLERTNAWEIACTIAAEVYARSQEPDNLVSQALVNSYKCLKVKNGHVSIFNLANGILSLRDENIGQDYVYSTIEGRGFRIDKGDKFNIKLHISRSETKVKLEEADFRELVKVFRFYVEEACRRMFNPRSDIDEWDASFAMYRPHKGSAQCTSAMFCEFARKLLNIHWSLYKLSEELYEVKDAMDSVRAASQKTRDNKKIENYEKQKKESLVKEFTTSKGSKNVVVETKVPNKIITLGTPVPPAPKDAWKNGNPLVENIKPVILPGNSDSASIGS